MAKPPESRIFNFQLHRATLWTMGCGLLLAAGVTFFAGSLVGAWWVTRAAQRGAAPTAAESLGAADGTAQATVDSTGAAGVTESGAAEPAPSGGGSSLVRGPTATAPSVLAPSVRGPTVSSSGIRGPTVRGPQTTGPRVQGPRANVPTSTSPTVGGGRLGGGQVRGDDLRSGDVPAGGPTPSVAAGGDAGAAGLTPGGQPTVANAESIVDPQIVDEVPPTPAYQYAVQVGLFVEHEEAKALIESLGEQGYEPYIKLLRSEKRRVVVRSIRLGPWPDRSQAEETAANFRADTRLGAAVIREAVDPSAND